MLMPSLYERSGNSMHDSQHAGRAIVNAQTAARDDLLADGLRVRVDVRPAPVRGAIEAPLDDAIGDELALHAPELGLVRGSVDGLAPRRQVLACDFGELALAERVVGAVLRLRDEIEALGDLAVGVPGGRVELTASRERRGARVLLVDGPLTAACDVARARVEHCRGPGVARERARQRDEVLGAEGVGRRSPRRAAG